MVNLDTKNFWDTELNDYEKQIISVFVYDNLLIEKINKIESKQSKTIADVGCGTGNAFQYFKKFQKNYAVDYSENMLNIAKKKQTGNEKFILENIENYKLPVKVDITFAISSIIPDSLNHFFQMFDNIVKNTKKKGSIYFVVSSFEARTFFLQIEADYMFQKNIPVQTILEHIKKTERDINYSSFGYFVTSTKLIQKHWLREELLYRLERYNFNDIKIEKLKLNWEHQLRLPEYNQFPQSWLWLISIKI